MAKDKYNGKSASSGKSSGGTAGKKKYGGGGSSGDSVIPKEELLEWKKADTATYEKAAKDNTPIVLMFLDEEMTAIEANEALHSKELAELSKSKAAFVLIEYNADRTPSLDDGCPVPTSKLLSPNPSREYNISEYITVVVCDQYGNAYNRFNGSVPSPKDLQKKIDEMAKGIDANNAKLQKNLDAAKKALEAKDQAGFLKAALANFKTDLVGLPAQEQTIKAYRELVDGARSEVNSILEGKPADGEKRLKDMAKTFKGTELAKEIEDALEILKG